MVPDTLIEPSELDGKLTPLLNEFGWYVSHLMQQYDHSVLVELGCGLVEGIVHQDLTVEGSVQLPMWWHDVILAIAGDGVGVGLLDHVPALGGWIEVSERDRVVACVLRNFDSHLLGEEQLQS